MNHSAVAVMISWGDGKHPPLWDMREMDVALVHSLQLSYYHSALMY